MDFAVLVGHSEKLKENEKKDNYLDFTRELKKLRNMKVTVILIVAGAPSTVTKRLVQGLKDLEIRGRVETIQSTALIRLTGGLRVLETWGDLLSLAPVENHLLTMEWKTLKWVKQ